MNNKAIYQFKSDVLISVNSKTGGTNIIKLNDDNYLFQASLVASEIIRAIDGKKSVQEILSKVCNMYETNHASLIESKGIELIAQLLTEKLLEEVKA